MTDQLPLDTVYYILQNAEYLYSLMGRSMSLTKRELLQAKEENDEIDDDLVNFFDALFVRSCKPTALPDEVFVTDLVGIVLDEDRAAARKLLNFLRNTRMVTLLHLSQTYSIMDADDEFEIIERAFEKAQLAAARGEPTLTHDAILYGVAFLILEERGIYNPSEE